MAMPFLPAGGEAETGATGTITAGTEARPDNLFPHLRSNDVLQNGQPGTGKRAVSAAPRLFIVRYPPAQRSDGEAKLERVQAYLLRQLRAAKRLGLPGYVRHYSIGFHSLLIARVMRQKGVYP